MFLKNIFVLGFNEPNQHEQSNLEPELAAEAWIDIQVYKYKLNKDKSCLCIVKQSKGKCEM